MDADLGMKHAANEWLIKKGCWKKPNSIQSCDQGRYR